jgi:integrase
MVVESKVQEYLGSLKTEGTRQTYKIALDRFAKFLQSRGIESVQSWLVAVDEDRTRPVMSEENTNIAHKTLKGFSESLQAEGLAPDSTRCYMGAIQNLYLFVFHERYSLKFTKLPDALEQTQKYPWTLESISRFLSTFDNLMYRCLGVLLLQSGLTLQDALSLTMSDLTEFGKKCPMELNFISKGRGKTHVPFSTFVGKATVKLLENLLETLLAGKTPNPDDRIFPITKQSVEAYWRVRARRFLEEGWPYRCPMSPHSFRTAFRTLAYNSRTIPELDIEFFLAHKEKRDMRHIYTVNGPEYFRQSYAKIEPYITPVLDPLPTEPIAAQVSVRTGSYNGKFSPFKKICV